jgi:hypothetical protein
MNLQRLLLIHAIITLAAGVVLIVAPAVIPKTVDIQIRPNEYLLSYFLGAAELGIAYLSFFSRTIQDKYALRIICTTFIVFHAATGILELYGLLQGISSKIIGNIFLRIVVVVLFYYYGIYKNKQQKISTGKTI